MSQTQNGALKRDDNDSPVMGGTSSSDNATIINAAFDPVTRRLLTDTAGGGTGTVTEVDTGTGLTGGPITTTGTISLDSKLAPMDSLTGNSLKVLRVNAGETAVEYATPGSGTVTAVSVASANGLAGTSSGGATPALTLSTTISGILKGNGTAISQAAAGTDYQIPITLTTTGTSGASTFNTGTGALNIPNYTVSGSGLTVGSTVITSGTTTRILYDNAGVLGEYTITGTGTVVAMQTSPAFTTPSLGVATATSINGLTITTSTGTLTIANLKTATFSNTLTFTGTDGTSFAFPATSDTVVTLTATQTLTNKTLTSPTLTTPVINGTATGTGVSATPTASIIAMWDASKNLSANNFLAGFTTTATAAGTTALTITSTEQQVFTGSTTQIVTLPTTSVVAGGSYTIINKSTGAVTVQSSGANTITILGAGTSAVFTALVATPTTAANWNSQYFGDIVASGKVLTVSNSITLAGTDGTTMTFPSTSATIYSTATGSITSAQLATSLTDETGTGANVFAAKPTFVGTIQTISALAALALDGSTGSIFTKTIGTGSTFTQSNFSTGQVFMLKVTGAFTITFFSTITWITTGGTQPTQGAITTYGFVCTGSNTFDGYLVGSQ